MGTMTRTRRRRPRPFPLVETQRVLDWLRQHHAPLHTLPAICRREARRTARWIRPLIGR